MIKLFFRQNNEEKFIEISPETYERLRLYSIKLALPIGKVTQMIYDRFGKISEEIILRNFNLIAERKNNRRICTKKNPFTAPLKENEVWIHPNAVQTDPPDYDGSILNFHCPNCGENFATNCS